MSAFTNLPEATLWESIIHCLHEAAADLVCYLGLNAPVLHMVDKLKLMYGMAASCDILVQNIYRLQQAK